MARLLLYALGGGWGHATRGLALGRAAARRGHEVHLLCNSVHAGRIDASELGAGQLEILPPGLDRATSAEYVGRRLRAGPWDLLVVDTFPRGLGGEFVGLWSDLHAPCAWVHRDLEPRYLERFGIAEWAKRFERILIPGEDAPLQGLPQAHRTAPWLVRDAGELLSPAAARAQLGARGGRPVVVVSESGTPEEHVEAEALERLLSEGLPEAQVIRVGPKGLQVWPLLELLPGVDLLVGSGGYNTVQEARASGTPFLGIPRPRRYDRQERRLAHAERVEGGSLLERARARLAEPRPEVPPYPNGVDHALDVLEELLP